MNIIMLEPLGVPQEKIIELSKALEKEGHSFTYYSTRTEDTKELTERAKAADVVILSNLPFLPEPWP